MESEASSATVVLADPQQVSRIGTREALEGDGVVVVGEAASGEDALRLVRELTPDVLVCEMDLPDVSGLQVAVRLSEEDSPVQVLALTAYEGVSAAGGLGLCVLSVKALKEIRGRRRG